MPRRGENVSEMFIVTFTTEMSNYLGTTCLYLRHLLHLPIFFRKKNEIIIISGISLKLIVLDIISIINRLNEQRYANWNTLYNASRYLFSILGLIYANFNGLPINSGNRFIAPNLQSKARRS